MLVAIVAVALGVACMRFCECHMHYRWVVNIFRAGSVCLVGALAVFVLHGRLLACQFIPEGNCHFRHVSPLVQYINLLSCVCLLGYDCSGLHGAC